MGANGLNISNSGSVEFLAAAASALTMPVAALSMSMLGNSGTYGASMTLEAPMSNYYKSQRENLLDFFADVLGSSADVRFLPLNQDELLENIKQVSIGHDKGIISDVEYRKELSLLFGLKLDDEVPDFDEFYQAKMVKYQSVVAISAKGEDVLDPDDPLNQGGASGGATEREDSGQSGT